MNFSEAFIRRPVMTVLLSASAVVAGALAYGDIPIAALPKFKTPTIQVTACRPGASPRIYAAGAMSATAKQVREELRGTRRLIAEVAQRCMPLSSRPHN